MAKTRRALLGALALALLVAGAGAQADPAAEFFRGKQVRLIVGYGPGGGYDVYARLLARHLGNYIPGKPTVVVQNMPGAGSLRAANHIYTTAPKDGTVIGTFARDMPLLAILGKTRTCSSTRENSPGWARRRVSAMMPICSSCAPTRP